MLEISYQQMDSCINLLRGKIYEAMDNRNLAAECFREALREDVYCYEAFHCLVNHQMLTAQEGVIVYCLVVWCNICGVIVPEMSELYCSKLKERSNWKCQVMCDDLGVISKIFFVFSLYWEWAWHEFE